MAAKIKKFFKKITLKRTTVVILLFIFMSAVLIQHLFHLQIVDGEKYASQFSVMTTKKRTIKSTRGTIYDRNGNILASNRLSYSLTLEDNGSYETTRQKNLTLNSVAYHLLQILESNNDAPDRDFHIILDDAGNYYCALGWAYARGKGKDIHTYEKEEKIFASCAGAAIYRKKIFDKIGYFDEEHFAYLEDMDVGYRARIHGYENWYAPDAMVYHVGSGTSGSRYNQFKIRYSSRNNIYLIYKNMPVLQIIINLPFLVVGFGIKILFFALKGFGREYIAGIKNGFQISRKNQKVSFKLRNLPNYLKIQLELWVNIFRRFRG